MAAQGTKSLHYLSLYTLTLMLSPIGFGAFVIGIGQVGRLAFTRARVAPLAICSLGFFAALTIKQLTTPYLYYFGRYLVSELLPLAVICAAIAVHSLSRYAPRLRHGIFTAFCLCVFALLYPSLRTRLKIQEGRQFYEALSCVDQVTPGRSVILVDKRDLPVVPIVTALRFSFQKPIFAFKELPVNQQRRVRELKEYFTSKGYSVYLLSAHDTWGSGDGFGRILRIPAIMRRVGGRAEAPTKITTLSHPIRLYSLQTPNTLPEICQKVREYSR
jgi:hypothetical protein